MDRTISPRSEKKLVGLFSGIGGLELPFHKRGVETLMMCDVWGAAQRVLSARFPGVEVVGDIADIKSLPGDADIVTAGFPCTDLSQAGRTAGIGGAESGLVAHVFRLLKKQSIEWLVLENVRNMLVLDRGEAMHYLTSQLESLGFRWAYRLVDSRFSGVPQRRHRVLFVASRHHDPRDVLFADDEQIEAVDSLRSDAYGFYWTEGLKGLGWAQDAIPPLKGGSGLGIPSPPAIWVPSAKPGSRLVTPSIEDAEVLQGFAAGWTEPACTGRSNSPRWKLVGNAVTVGVSDWLVGRLLAPGESIVESEEVPKAHKWPDAAYGELGKRWKMHASQWPVEPQYRHLLDSVSLSKSKPLSKRAASGFLQRATRSSLRFDSKFLTDVERHIEYVA